MIACILAGGLKEVYMVQTRRVYSASPLPKSRPKSRKRGKRAHFRACHYLRHQAGICLISTRRWKAGDCTAATSLTAHKRIDAPKEISKRVGGAGIVQMPEMFSCKVPTITVEDNTGSSLTRLISKAYPINAINSSDSFLRGPKQN